jgi:hypothetical protein
MPHPSGWSPPGGGGGGGGHAAQPSFYTSGRHGTPGEQRRAATVTAPPVQRGSGALGGTPRSPAALPVAAAVPIARAVPVRPLPAASATPMLRSRDGVGQPLAQAVGELVTSADSSGSSYSGVVARAVPIDEAQDPMSTLRAMLLTRPRPDAILDVFRQIEQRGAPAGVTQTMFKALTTQVREKWGQEVWTRSVMVQHAQVQERFPESLQLEPEPEPARRATTYGGGRPSTSTMYGRSSPTTGRAQTSTYGRSGGSPGPPSPAPAVGGGGSGGGGGGGGGGGYIGGGVSAVAADDDSDDDEEGQREMEAAMEHVRRLGEIRELQRRNIREGIGDAEGTDERVVAMYADLIDTAGLTYQGVVQHDKVAKGLTKEKLERIQPKRNPSRTDCALCLEPMQVGLRVATLPCCGEYLCSSCRCQVLLQLRAASVVIHHD